jgi:hypothetical protein
MQKEKPKKKRKAKNPLQCPHCKRDFSSIFYLHEHYCHILKIEFKNKQKSV